VDRPIDISGTDHQVASWIWHNMVPPKGQASTIQGELLRAVEKLRWEAQQNGNINWDGGFVILVSFLEEHLLGPGFSSPHRQALQVDLGSIRNSVGVEEPHDEQDAGGLPCIDDELYDRLTSHVVAFARANPEPIPRQPNPLLHR
jgi:hypothetical protein